MISLRRAAASQPRSCILMNRLLKLRAGRCLVDELVGADRLDLRHPAVAQPQLRLDSRHQLQERVDAGGSFVLFVWYAIVFRDPMRPEIRGIQALLGPNMSWKSSGERVAGLKPPVTRRDHHL